MRVRRSGRVCEDMLEDVVEGCEKICKCAC